MILEIFTLLLVAYVAAAGFNVMLTKIYMLSLKKEKLKKENEQDGN